MIRVFRLIGVAAATCAVPLLVAAMPQTQAPAQPAPVFRTGTTAVLLDIVVRDKRGRPVRDLRPRDRTHRPRHHERRTPRASALRRSRPARGP